MSTSGPIDLGAHRRARERRRGQEANRRGEAFGFQPYVYAEDGIGTIETNEVIVVVDHQAKTGVRMSRQDALRLGAALILAAVETAEELPPDAGNG